MQRVLARKPVAIINFHYKACRCRDNESCSNTSELLNFDATQAEDTRVCEAAARDHKIAAAKQSSLSLAILIST